MIAERRTTHFWWAVTCSICFLQISTLGAQTPSYSLEDILGVPFASNLIASPVGNQVAWVITDQGVRNIWVAEGPDFEAVKVTFFLEDDGQAIGNLTFDRSGNKLYFERGGNSNRAGEFPNPRSETESPKQEIWRIDLVNQSNEALVVGSNYALRQDEKVLTYIKKGAVWQKDLEPGNDPYQLFEMRGTPSSLRWSPHAEKKLLAFVSNRGDHSYIGLYDADKNQIEYLSPSVDHDHYPSWSQDGKQLAFVREPNEKQQLIFMPRRETLPWSILVHRVEENKTTVVWTAPPGEGSAYRFISGGRQLFWLDNSQLILPYEGQGWTHLYAHDLSPQELAVQITNGSYEVQFVSISTDRNEILYSSNQDDVDRQHIWTFSRDDQIPKQVTRGQGIEWGAVKTKGGQIVTLASSYNQPAQVVLVDQHGKLKSITAQLIPNTYPVDQHVKPEQVVFYAADGMRIHGQLFLPRQLDQNSRQPGVLFFHGGSRRQMKLGYHHSQYYHHAYALNQYLASQGFVVLSVNYRSGIGYGMKFREAENYGARGASEFNDVLGAGLYLRSRSDVDPDKIGLWGGSYGGYLTALGLARASDLFAAGVDIHGVHDWNVVIKNFVTSYDAAKRDDVATLAFESSPMAAIQDWRSPVLIIHGDDDRNVPFSESVDLVEALRNQDVYFEQLIFPDEVHGFLLHANWLSAYKATADFFNRMLR
ncbi:MAG: prolyl oligopeptidase family serine peptidase [Saprospiraceae bacterium]|nr:prolyl oligopeptidase family serine peptidase [Saprospiraceae bacterium]